MLFHLGFSFIPGGFAGVDVFFVISGFLIGGIIVAELDQDRFSFAHFYLRRVRRILPALILMLVVVTIAAWFVLLPADYVRYAMSLIAASLSGANIYFSQTTGYFDVLAVRPLLHLWSLGVEEQFYILFPPCLWLIRRFAPRHRTALIAAATLLSFAIAAYAVPRYANFGFYLPVTRAWELLLGNLVAILPRRLFRSSTVCEITAGCGLALLTLSMFLLNSAMAFPGVAALAPCVGTALVIAAGTGGRTTLVGRILQARFLVWTGLVSFSLYLWHWPMIVLVQYVTTSPALTLAQQIAILIATYLVSFLSWRYVEHPFRVSRAPPRKAFTIAGGAVAAVCLIGAAIGATHGVPGRFSPEVARTAAYLSYDPAPHFREHRCFLRPHEKTTTLIAAGCTRISPTEPNVLVIGNSHAAHLWEGLAQAAPSVNVMQATASGSNCLPLVDQHEKDHCGPLWHYVFDDLLKPHSVNLVIVSANYETPDLAGLAGTLATLRARGIPVLLMGPGPQYLLPLPHLLAAAAMHGDPTLPRRSEDASPRRFDPQLSAIAAQQGAGYLSAYAALCTGGCVTTVEGRPVQFDADHLTIDGSRIVARAIMATPSWQDAVTGAVRRPD